MISGGKELSWAWFESSSLQLARTYLLNRLVIRPEGTRKENEEKLPCCGEGCTDSQCLGYLAMAVKTLQAPINGTLDSGEHNKARVSEEAEEDKSEL